MSDIPTCFIMTGVGRSKKIAKKSAAAAMLLRIENCEDLLNSSSGANSFPESSVMASIMLVSSNIWHVITRDALDPEFWDLVESSGSSQMQIQTGF